MELIVVHTCAAERYHTSETEVGHGRPQSDIPDRSSTKHDFVSIYVHLFSTK